MSIERDKDFEQLEDIAAMMTENPGIEFENGKYVYYGLDARTAFAAVYISGAWVGWQAKANAVPEGFVLVEKSKVRTWYQDDDEPENFCNSESDLDCLGDCLDDDDIITVNIHESAHISTRKVFGVWKSNSPTDIQSKFILVDSHEEAEKIVASNKAMLAASQEPK